MVKPKRLNKYDKAHLNALQGQFALIDKIYKGAAAKVAALCDNADIPTDKDFNLKEHPMLQKQINQLTEGVKKQLNHVVVDAIEFEWDLANEKNDAFVNQMLGVSVRQLSEKNRKKYFNNNASALDAFLKRRQNGLNLSDRVWQYSQQYKGEIEDAIQSGIAEGVSADEMSQHVRQYLNKPNKRFKRRDKDGNLVLSAAAKAYHPGLGVYRSSYKNARRLTATETNMAYRTADHLRWQAMDFVVGVEIDVSHTNHPVVDICDTLKGKYPKDFKFVGWHPHCRCTAIPIMKTEEDFINDEEGSKEVKELPEQYAKWIADNEERLKVGSVPYFVRDNEHLMKRVSNTSTRGKKQQNEEKSVSKEGILRAAAKRHKARTPEQSEQIQKAWEERQEQNKRIDSWIEAYPDIVKAKVARYDGHRTEEEIIKMVGGRDKTGGSCASVALAYAGQKHGYDVLDYRGGKSQDFFASNIIRTSILFGGELAEEYNDFVAAKKLLATMEEGKEYILSIAKHASVVRRVGKEYQYLELQGEDRFNGYHTLNRWILKNRFGCAPRHTVVGIKWKNRATLISTDKFVENQNFKKLAEIFNTNTEHQMKGEGGGIK